jgi:hypothetical protein
MKSLGIAWTVVANLITIFIVIAILDSLEYEDTLQTISALIMFAYVSINASLTMIFRSQLQLTIFLTEQNAQIIKSIPDSNKNAAVDLEEDAKVAQKALTNTNKKYYINVVGNTLVWIITIFTLLGNI